MKIFLLPFPLKTFQVRSWLPVLLMWGVGTMVLGGANVFAQEAGIPWECSEYSGEAQTRCMRMLLELQQEKIAKLEAQLKAQEGTLAELKSKVDRQQALANQEKKTYKKDPRWPPPPYVPPAAPAYAPSYGPPYSYVPLPPIGIYVPPPWQYPRFFGYGPGYWGGSGLFFNFRIGG